MQLLSIRREAEPAKLHPNNPFPPGVMRPGSATDAVAQFLAERPLAWWSRRQIMAATGRTDKAVNWALRFLLSTHRIECAHTDARNPLYRRFRWRPDPTPTTKGPT